MAISEELKDIYGGNSNNAIAIETIEISHPNSETIFRFCNFYTTINAYDEEGEQKQYTPANFIIGMPSLESSKAALSYSVSFQNIDFKAIEFLNEVTANNTSDPILLTIRIYTDKQFSYPQTTVPFNISIYDTTITSDTITLTGKQMLSTDKSIPLLKYSSTVFTGI